MTLFFRKKIVLPTALIDELLALDWFCNCGKQGNTQFILVSKEHASRCITSREWERIVLEHRGKVTEALSARECAGKGKEYRSWNDLVNRFKQEYMAQLGDLWANRLRRCDLDSNDFLDALRFTILALVTVYAYRDIVEVPHFFDQLLEAVRAGRYPCGYDEENQRIVVY